MLRRIVILGHTGFIGSHLEERLRTNTALEVVGRSPPEVDLRVLTNALALRELLDERTALVLCSGVKPAVANDFDAFHANVAIAANVAKLIEASAVARILFFSSAAVYGEDAENTAITEATPVAPSSYYGIAKYASERLLYRSVHEPDDRLMIVRPATVFGPGDASRQYGPSAFVDAVLHGGTVTLWGDGSERREFVFVGDVVRIVERLLVDGGGGVVNIVTGESRSFSEILAAVSAAAGRAPAVVSRPRTRPKVDHGFIPVGLRERLPGSTFTPLAEAIARTIG